MITSLLDRRKLHKVAHIVDLWIMCCLLHRKLKEQVSCSLNSAKTAKQQIQLYKARVVHSMNEEYKEMMRQALDEVSFSIL